MDSTQMKMKAKLDSNQEEIKASKEEIIAELKVWHEKMPARNQGKPKLLLA
jgi:hypothetical protein